MKTILTFILLFLVLVSQPALIQSSDLGYEMGYSDAERRQTLEQQENEAQQAIREQQAYEAGRRAQEEAQANARRAQKAAQEAAEENARRARAKKARRATGKNPQYMLDSKGKWRELQVYDGAGGKIIGVPR